MSNKSFGFFSLIIFYLFGIGTIFGHPLSDIYDVCERYTQCRTIATLDERLCLGNTRSMPFWLPPSSLKNDEMSEHCHKSLKPYYKQLERMESEESQQLLVCLMEQKVPINSEQRLQCHQNLRRSPKYNFNEDLMDRIPTNCFQGIERRLEKQCGILRDCCSSVENCANFENSEITTKIRKLKEFIKDYGKQCQLGLATEDLFFNEDGNLEKKAEQKPNGNIIVRFNTEEKPKQYSPKIDTNQSRLLVRVFTAAEEIERLRESGDDVEADKLQKELEDIEGMFKGTSTKTISTSELEGTVPLSGTTASTTTETGDEFWSTQAPKMITGLEIATDASTSTSTTTKTEVPTTSAETTTPTTSVTSTTTSTSSTPPPPTTTTSTSTTTTTTTTVPETTSTTTTTPSPTTSTTTRIHLITDTPQPEASEEESEALIPNRSPPNTHRSTPTNDPPKTVTTHPPYPVDDILKKYSHVKTLNKLVEHFKDQNSETFTKNEPHQTTPTFIDSDKLHKFYDRWENSIREKLASNNVGGGENDAEAAQEHARLLKTLNTLRNVIYNN